MDIVYYTPSNTLLYRCVQCFRLGEQGSVCKNNSDHGYLGSDTYMLGYRLDFCETCNAYYTYVEPHKRTSMNHSILYSHMIVSAYVDITRTLPSLLTLNRNMNKECDLCIEELKTLAANGKMFPQTVNSDANGTLDKVSLFCNSIPLCKEKKDLEGKMETLKELMKQTDRVGKLFRYMSDDIFMEKLDKIFSMADGVDVSL
jgi:hypothetical protein